MNNIFEPIFEPTFVYLYNDECLTLPSPDECPTLYEICYVQIRNNVVDVLNMTREQIWKLATTISLQDATELLNASATTLKLICREKEIKFWPYRKFFSYKKLLVSPYVCEPTKVLIRRILDSSMIHQFNFPEDLDEKLKKIKQKVYKAENREKTK
jgi:hypothetical protein